MAPQRVIRAMHERDLARVREISLQAFEQAWPDEQLRADLEAPQAIMLVAIEDDEIVGFAITRLILDEAELWRVATDPRRRRQGIGRALVERSRRQAFAAGARRILLEVRADNDAALALYRDLGFVSIDRRARYYRDGADAIVMENWAPAT